MRAIQVESSSPQTPWWSPTNICWRNLATLMTQLRMLRLLSGRTHQVITGVCLVAPGYERTEAEITQVLFSPMSKDEIVFYVKTGEPMDKAGAYAIQGIASRWVQRIEGCYFNVVGLPLSRVYRMLREAEAATGASLM